MIDWTMLSSTFLTAVIEWAVAVVTVLAAGPRSKSSREKPMTKIPSHLSLPPVRCLAAE
jgi:hypothetical protein